ncbi:MULTISPECIES: CvpA family protein [Treponema]|uniref:CvpA family protein n=1 Tax=Treponema TaxID=157 RepID=UPI003FD84CFD
MHFGFIDVVFFIIILFFAITACAKGFLKELFGKLALVSGILVAVFFCGSLSPFLEKIIKIKTVCLVTSFILLFIVVFLFVKILQTIIAGLFKGEILKSLDKILGFAIGMAEGLVIVSAIVIVLKAQPWFSTDFIDSTFFWTYFSPILAKPIVTLGAVFV